MSSIIRLDSYFSIPYCSMELLLKIQIMGNLPYRGGSLYPLFYYLLLGTAARVTIAFET